MLSIKLNKVEPYDISIMEEAVEHESIQKGERQKYR